MRRERFIRCERYGCKKWVRNTPYMRQRIVRHYCDLHQPMLPDGLGTKAYRMWYDAEMSAGYGMATVRE